MASGIRTHTKVEDITDRVAFGKLVSLMFKRYRNRDTHKKQGGKTKDYVKYLSSQEDYHSLPEV